MKTACFKGESGMKTACFTGTVVASSDLLTLASHLLTLASHLLTLASIVLTLGSHVLTLVGYLLTLATKLLTLASGAAKTPELTARAAPYSGPQNHQSSNKTRRDFAYRVQT